MKGREREREREIKGENKNRFQISCRELFRKSLVGNECERMCECSREEKKRTKYVQKERPSHDE